MGNKPAFVPCTRLQDISREQVLSTVESFKQRQATLPDRIMDMLKHLDTLVEGGLSQLGHSLQTATLAYRDNASDEQVLCALCHDIGKAIGQVGHAQISAEILRPYVSEHSFHIVYTHEEFQGRFYYQYIGLDPDLYLRHEHEPWFQDACRFSSDWDARAFDVNATTKPLDEFEPLVRDRFSSVSSALVGRHGAS